MKNYICDSYKECKIPKGACIHIKPHEKEDECEEHCIIDGKKCYCIEMKTLEQIKGE
jgi:hypothetical protein